MGCEGDRLGTTEPGRTCSGWGHAACCGHNEAETETREPQKLHTAELRHSLCITGPPQAPHRPLKWVPMKDMTAGWDTGGQSIGGSRWDEGWQRASVSRPRGAGHTYSIYAQEEAWATGVIPDLGGHPRGFSRSWEAGYGSGSVWFK